MREELIELCRMVAMGRPDAAIKLGNYLADLLEKPAEPEVVQVQIDKPKRKKAE